MFEDRTAENILDEMLGSVPNTLDKREGSLIFNALAPVAMEIASAYEGINAALDEAFADAASLEALKEIAAMRGIEYIDADYAVITANIEFGGEGEELNQNDIFVYEDSFFEYTGNMILDAYELRAAEKKLIYDRIRNGVDLIYNGGAYLKSAKVESVISSGRNGETLEEFRTRYFESFDSLSFAGNKAMWRDKLIGIPGIGGVRAFRGSYEDNKVLTVIRITDADFSPIENRELIKSAQAQADEWAPVGMTPVVKWANTFYLSFLEGSEIRVSAASDAEAVKTNIFAVIKEYVEDLNFLWGHTDDDITISSFDIFQRIINVDGVTGYENLTIDTTNTEDGATGSHVLLENNKKAVLPSGSVISFSEEVSKSNLSVVNDV